MLNKDKLKLDITNMLNSDKVTKVFENAVLSMFPTMTNDEKADSGSEDIAKMFGSICAKGLSNALAGPLADAIDIYVKGIGITITPKTLTCPVGPVTGAIAPTDVIVS